VVAIGDDRTDEDLFEALPPEAITIRVGPGPTRARFRLDGINAVRALLQALVTPASTRVLAQP
jgi:trehalose 6-phosphate synthase/phosphatase